MLKKNRKGQLKIQEMAFVLVAVVFLFALVFIFFVQFQTRALSEQARIIRERQTIALLDYVAAMPELGCSGLEKAGGVTVIICVDLDKLKVFNETDTIRDNYKILWKSARVLEVKVKEMYPGSAEYLIYEASKEEMSYAEARETYSTFIPVCEADRGGTQCQIGRILITTEMPI